MAVVKEDSCGLCVEVTDLPGLMLCDRTGREHA